jgi:hypothetical protein
MVALGVDMAQVELDAELVQDVPCSVSSVGNWIVIKLPDVRLFIVVKVTVCVVKALTELLDTEADAETMLPALAVIVLKTESM